jgi:hypothetical protein
MPPVAQTRVVEGLADLNRAFALADAKVRREFRNELREVAEPVRVDAESLATVAIPRIGIPWSRMRIGVTRNTVYVAPRQRGSRVPPRRRPNLAALLRDRAMVPAVERNEDNIVRGADQFLVDVAKVWGAA